MDTTDINWQYEKSNVDWDSKEKCYEWAEELKKEKGIRRTIIGLPLLFSKSTKQGEKTNWLGIIAVFNITFNIVGFKLFTDQ